MTTSAPLRRAHGRAADALRPVSISPHAMKYAEGSALVELGDTRVLIAATVENRVPSFLSGSGKGWLTAEYAMLPRATSTRSAREVTKGRPTGRSAEIQRLIGRSLRPAFDLTALGERTLTLDCDVLQADGGTRTASVTGAYVAAVVALGRLFLTGDLLRWPVVAQVAAVSVGIVGETPCLDLDAPEDQDAQVDMNVIATAAGELIEVQGTGEARPFRRQEMDLLLDLAAQGITVLAQEQARVLRATLDEVALVRERGKRRPAAPRDERTLYGKPS